MKLKDFELGTKLEKKQLEIISWGGDTKSNGFTTKSAGDDCDDSNGDYDGGSGGYY